MSRGLGCSNINDKGVCLRNMSWFIVGGPRMGKFSVVGKVHREIFCEFKTRCEPPDISAVLPKLGRFIVDGIGQGNEKQ